MRAEIPLMHEEGKMKAENRVRLYCTRKLRNGIIDSFHAIASKDTLQEISEKYKAMGYTVIKEA